MDGEAAPFWLISTPLRANYTNANDEWNKILMATSKSDLAQIWHFKVPVKELKVGTLDTLIALSDDLAKADSTAKSTTYSIYNKLFDLQKDGVGFEEPEVPIGANGRVGTMEQYLADFEWDSAKYPVNQPLKDLAESLCASLARVDEEGKAKFTEYNQARTAKQTQERKEQGSLMVKSLADVVKKEDILETEHITTLLVCVPKYAMKDWQTSYASLGTIEGKEGSYVVPGSSKTVAEDQDFALVTVALFKGAVEGFKHNAIAKRFTIRDYAFDADSNTAEAEEKAKALSDFDRVKSAFMRWCKTNFAEAYAAMVHLKVLRLFVESVLRYGVPPNFQAVLIKPRPRKEVALRKALGNLYGHLAASEMLGGGDEIDMPGDTSEFFPYVSLDVTTAPAAA